VQSEPKKRENSFVNFFGIKIHWLPSCAKIVIHFGSEPEAFRSREQALEGFLVGVVVFSNG
jgi:hypothetical protein